jgi:hypothetical protein
MAATVAPSHAGGLPSSSGIPAPPHPHDAADASAGSQDVAGGVSPLPPTRKFQLRDFRRVRTLGTGLHCLVSLNSSPSL